MTTHRVGWAWVYASAAADRLPCPAVQAISSVSGSASMAQSAIIQ